MAPFTSCFTKASFIFFLVAVLFLLLLQFDVEENEPSGMASSAQASAVIIISRDLPLSIEFVFPTTVEGFHNQDFIFANVTAFTSFLDNVTIFLYNSSFDLINFSFSNSSPFFDSFTGLSDGRYFLNASVFDTFGLSNKTETRDIFLKTVPPVVSLISPVSNASTSVTTVVFTYDLFDDTPTNCSLIVNGVVLDSDVGIISGIHSFTQVLGAGGFDWNISCVNSVGLTGLSETRHLSVVPVPPVPDRVGGGSSAHVPIISKNVTDDIEEELFEDIEKIDDEYPVGLEEVPDNVYDFQKPKVKVITQVKKQKFELLFIAVFSIILIAVIIILKTHKNNKGGKSIKKADLKLEPIDKKIKKFNKMSDKYFNEDKVVVFSILFIILAVGVAGLFFSNRMTGMVVAEQRFEYTIANFVDLKLTAGDGVDVKFRASITPTGTSVITFDSFGNCVGCHDFVIEEAPYNVNYAGILDNNQSLFAVLKTDSNTQIDLSVKLNDSLPSGFNSMSITSRSFDNVSTNGTERFAFNSLTDGFDDAGALDLTTANQQLLGNWSDGTGFGGVSEAISCKWSIRPFDLPAGNYLILVDYSGTI